MPKFADLIGQKFGRLTVVERTPKPLHIICRGIYWLCLCECGERRIIRSGELKERKSCGCHRKTQGGLTYKDGAIHPLWTIWTNIKRRCLDPEHKSFKHYGGRGIGVCSKWLTFGPFVADILSEIGDRPSKKHSLDRKNNDENYEAGNIRWATASEQRRNQRKRGDIFVMTALLGFGC